MKNNMTPKTIYHYTSLDAFLKIMESGKIWLTELSKLNDPNEQSLGLRLIKEKIIERLGCEKGERIVELIEREEGENIYLTCSFSETDEDLSQWRAYGNDGKGLCIGLDYNKINEFSRTQNSEMVVHLDRVIYNKNEFLDSIEKRINEHDFLEGVDELLEEDHGEKPLLLLNSKTAQKMYTMMFKACQFKDEIYEVEKEIRVMGVINMEYLRTYEDSKVAQNELSGMINEKRSLIEKIESGEESSGLNVEVIKEKIKFYESEIESIGLNRHFDIKHRESSYGIATYVELDIRQFIHSITIGPNSKSTVNDLKRFLYLNGNNDICIREIGYKYRS